MKKLLSLLSLLCLMGSWPLSAIPNVVLIYVDDLGYGDLGCYGATKVQTPNIDRLAREGRSFYDAHSPSAVCTPSRYGLMMGEYPFRYGEEGVWGPKSFPTQLLLDPDRLTLGSLFEEAGYATAAVGKWHLGFGEKRADFNKPLRPGPLEVGFDYYFGISTNNSAPPYVFLENDRVYGWDPDDPLVPLDKPGPPPYPIDKVDRMGGVRFTGARIARDLFDNHLVGTRCAEKAVDWLRANSGQPFFLYFAPPQIHHPFTPHPRFVGTSQAGMYGDFIHELDWMVGEVLNALDELGKTDDTLVVFTSDNGGMFNLGGRQAWDLGHRQNGDLLGFKFGVWEGGHRVPFIARWPGEIEAGSSSQYLLSNLDLLASFSALLGRDLENGDAPDSFNQLETLIGDPGGPVRNHVVLLPREEQNTGLRKDKWVYISSQGDGSGGIGTSKRGGPWAVAYTKSKNSDVASDGTIRSNAPGEQLYNLETDPHQTNNVIRNNPQVAAEMRRALKTYRESSSTRTAAISTDGFKSLFNGQDLSDWDGDPDLWKVENGVVVGTNTGPGAMENNSFLIWRGGTLKDFELRATVRVIGDNNSGIQYRSRERPDIGPWVISGYQCDVHPAIEHTGMTYEEKGRGIFGLNGKNVILDPDGERWLVSEHEPVKADTSQWNEYTVIARGNHLIHKVNGAITSELTDYHEAGRALEGLLAIQLHKGNPNRVEIKELRIKNLSDGKVLPFDTDTLPGGARKIEKPRTVNPQGVGPVLKGN